MSSRIWTEVGDRVYVRRYRTWHGFPFDQNVGAVLGADGVAIIDTRGSEVLADELRAELPKLTRARVAAVINTHHHWDHTWGNGRFAGTPIWGHSRCAARVLADSEHARGRILADEPGLADELGDVVFTPPDRTFDDRAVVDLGDRQVELRYLGLGHTDNDIAIVVPEARVLFAGDLLENDAPPSFGDAFPIAWAETAGQLLQLADGAVVPGHGSVGDRGFAERGQAELALVADLGRQVVAGTLDEADAVARSPFPAEVTATAFARTRAELAGAPSAA
jgi:glyoxylase-like metal-dependent hydrolase (beta-lactamase superfamily II)